MTFGPVDSSFNRERTGCSSQFRIDAGRCLDGPCIDAIGSCAGGVCLNAELGLIMGAEESAQTLQSVDAAGFDVQVHFVEERVES